MNILAHSDQQIVKRFSDFDNNLIETMAKTEGTTKTYASYACFCVTKWKANIILSDEVKTDRLPTLYQCTYRLLTTWNIYLQNWLNTLGAYTQQSKAYV